jgi:hypothetical protein
MTPLSQNKRKSVFEEKGGSCAFCGVTRQQHKDDCGRDLDLHHIIPERKGGEDSVENLLPVCRDCHQTLEKTQGKALGRIAEMETDQNELEKLRCERDRLKSKIEKLEYDNGQNEDKTAEAIASDIWQECEEHAYVDFEIVSKTVGRRVEVYTDVDIAVDAYDEWGSRMDKERVRISKPHMVGIINTVLEEIRE